MVLFVSTVQDESGSLERPEVVRALIKTIPEFTGRDEAWLLGTFAAIWSIIDPDADGETKLVLVLVGQEVRSQGSCRR